MEEAIIGTELLDNLERLHTTKLGAGRIRRNLSLDLSSDSSIDESDDIDEVVIWCRDKIRSSDAIITRNGKNWYIRVDGCVITVNAYSYTIITAHKNKENKS